MHKQGLRGRPDFSASASVIGNERQMTTRRGTIILVKSGELLLAWWCTDSLARVDLNYRNLTILAANKRQNRSFTASSRLCLQPRYRSVVRTDACPSRN